jgi:hypothetical protein
MQTQINVGDTIAYIKAGGGRSGRKKYLVSEYLFAHGFLPST